MDSEKKQSDFIFGSLRGGNLPRDKPIVVWLSYYQFELTAA